MYIEYPITGIKYRHYVFDFENRTFPSFFTPYPEVATCINLHGHQDMEFLYISDGAFSMMVNSVSMELRRGDLLIINPNDIHAGTVPIHQQVAGYHMIRVRLEHLTERENTSIHRVLSLLMDEKMKFSNYISCEIMEHSGLDLIMKGLIAAFRQQEDVSVFNQIGYLYLLFARLMSMELISRTPVIAEIKKRNQFVLQMLQYFDENWDQPITSKDAAQIFSYSQEYFCKIFKDNMGKTFSQFLIEIKVHKAKELLDAGEKAGAVMERVGLSNYSYFYRCFKRFYGVSPESFKRKLKK